MILHNIGTKIINVGSTILMPGDSMQISKVTAQLPAIEAFCEMGFTSIENDTPVVTCGSEDGEEATSPKRGRKAAVAANLAEKAESQ